MAWIAFLACTGLATLYFGFASRRFDLLTVGFIGALFYLSPLVLGSVIQMGYNYNPAIPAPVHLIGCAYMLALIAGGVMAAKVPQAAVSSNQHPDLSGWYLGIAVLGLTITVLASRGALFSMDKVEALKQVGYWYAGFEIAACLACLSAVAERRWWRLAFGVLLLCIDLLVGFRVFVVLTTLGVALVIRARSSALRLYTKVPSYGLAAVSLVAAMLLLHSARFAIFQQIAAFDQVSDTVAMTDAASMRGDIVQYQDLVNKRAANSSRSPDETSSATPDRSVTSVPRANIPNESGQSDSSSKQNTTNPGAQTPDDKWPFSFMRLPLMIFNLFEKSEPFTIQATLVETVNQSLVCAPGNIFKSLRLLAPPGFGAIWPHSYPPTFFDEYQPVLFPAVTYGLGGNIFAEMLCRFGYAGVAVFIASLVVILIGLQSLIWSTTIIFRAPLVLGGVIVAFYIYRNDVHYTLVLLRQTAIIFTGAWLFSWTKLQLSQRFAKSVKGETP